MGSEWQSDDPTPANHKPARPELDCDRYRSRFGSRPDVHFGWKADTDLLELSGSFSSKTLEYRLMEGPLKSNSADMAFNPAHRSFEGFETVEFDPDPLTDKWAFNELDFAAQW